MSAVYDFTKSKFMNNSDQHLCEVLSRASISPSSLILLVETRHDHVNPPALGIHFRLNPSPLSMVSRSSMDCHNCVLSLKSIIRDVTIPTLSQLYFETLGSLVLNFFLFRIFNPKQRQISSKDPFHFLMLECFLLRTTIIFNVVIEMLIVRRDELFVFTLFSWCHTLLNFQILYFLNFKLFISTTNQFIFNHRT